ncbi:MAG TPA: hypothetical protein VIV60_00220, partial [Polyangiaceae bacterium]
MKALEQWLSREKRRKLRQPRLDDALLGHRAVRYIVHRLRFVTLRVVLRTALHIVEIVALSAVFPARLLGPILILRHASLLLSSLHWGALEVQRQMLRDAYQSRDTAAFASVARRWSAATITILLVEQLTVVVIVAVTTNHQHAFSVYYAYGIACGLRLAMDTWARTQQSVVFSVARVRRTFSSIIITDILEVFGLLVAWLAIGPYAFALVLLLIGALKSTLTLLFARATRIQMDLPNSAGSILREWRKGSWLRLPWLRASKFAILNMGLQVDSLAILCLSSGLAGEAGVALSLSIHALSPLLGAGFAWTRVFYFDFIRLRRLKSSLLAHRFGRLLDRVALVYPLVLLAAVIPVVHWLAPRILVTTPLVLGGLVLSRSLFALRQMEAYSYADHRVQIRQATILLLITTAFVPMQLPLTMLIVAFTLGLVAAAVVGGRARLGIGAPRPSSPVCVEVFLTWLGAQSRPFRVVRLQWNPALTNGDRICRSLAKCGFASPTSMMARHQLMLAVPAACDPHALQRTLIRATAGTLKSVQLEPHSLTGIDNCRALALEAPALKCRSFETAARHSRPSIDSEFELVAAAFAREFPDGMCLRATQGDLRQLGDSASLEVRHLLRHFGDREPQRRNRRSGIETAVYRPLGDIKAVFVLPRASTRMREFAIWRNQLRAISIHHTFEGIISGASGTASRQTSSRASAAEH